MNREAKLRLCIREEGGRVRDEKRSGGELGRRISNVRK